MAGIARHVFTPPAEQEDPVYAETDFAAVDGFLLYALAADQPGVARVLARPGFRLSTLP